MNSNLLTASFVCNKLDISVKTLTRWYEWYYKKNPTGDSNIPELPEYIQAHDRAPRYWRKEDLPQLRKFKAWVPKGRAGVMSKAKLAESETN